MNLVWLKSDLRVLDNPALYQSIADGQTIACYFLSENQWDEHGISPAKKDLILRQLLDLQTSLNDLNVPLLIVPADGFSEIPELLGEILKELAIKKLFFNLEHEVNERRCEEQVRSVCNRESVSVSSFDDSCMIDAGTIRNGDGSPYKVFSAFKRSFVRVYQQRARKLYAKPSRQNNMISVSWSAALKPADIQAKIEALDVDAHYSSPNAELASDTDAITVGDSATRKDFHARWPSSEAYAHALLQEFADSRMESYQEDRDFPAKQGTSQLSAYLAVGALSTRQCIQAALGLNQGALDGPFPGVNTWINELIWREFYRHLLKDFPALCMHKPFKEQTDHLSWCRDTELFNAWKEGKTGYPIVDAGMRQLNETGWMHNRVRMITAMFLTKHLFVDWRLGEAYFMSKLIDGDLASNNGGWQWSASTGVDAVPYFRIFNPVRQSQRFDPDGAYIKRYVPELAGLDHKSVHMPTSAQALECGYVLPLVNHQEATQKTKLAFSNLNAPSRTSPQMELGTL